MFFTRKFSKSHFQSKFRAAHGAQLFLMIGVLFAVESVAFAATSWSQRPTWAADSGDEESEGKSRRPAYNSRNRLSPFSPGSNNVALHVGQVFLIGDLSDDFANSIGTQVHYTYGVSDMFAFNTSLGYSSHSDGDLSMTTLLTGVRTNLSWFDKVVPHVNFGMGFYRPSQEFEYNGRFQTVSPVLFGIHLGPGVDLELTENLFFGAALTFNDVFGTTKQVTGGRRVEIGGTFTTFLLHAGVTF